jgi:hypothetical protein
MQDRGVERSLVRQACSLAQPSRSRCEACRRPIPIGAGIGSRANCAGSGTGAASLANSRTWRPARCCSRWSSEGWWCCPRADAFRPTACATNKFGAPPQPTDLIGGALSELQPLQIQEWSRQPEAWPVFDSLLHQYHYLGYTSAVGKTSSIWCGTGGGAGVPVVGQFRFSPKGSFLSQAGPAADCAAVARDR